MVGKYAPLNQSLEFADFGPLACSLVAHPSVVLLIMNLIVAGVVFILTTMPGQLKAELATCPQLEEQDLSTKAVKDLIQNEKCGIRSIDDVLDHLPTSFRSQFALFYRSRSIQGPFETDYANPRVLLFGKSLKSKFMLTFNGDPSQPGNKSLEMVDINVAGGKDDLGVFKYSEIQFPYSDKGARGQSWQDVQAKIIYPKEANPQKCIACHSEPARPIYPGYPDWEGSFTSLHSRPTPKNEVAGLARLEKSFRDKDSRYSKLIVDDGSATFGEAGKTIERRVSALENQLSQTHGIINLRLGEANAIRVARLVRKTPDFDKFRYAIMGAFLGCDSFPSFLPADLQSDFLHNLDSRFALKRKWSAKEVDQMLHKIYDEPDLFALSKYRQILQFDNNHDLASSKNLSFQEFKAKFQRELGKPKDFERLQLDTISVQGIHRADPGVANLRLLMESRGLNIDNWFLDLTQPTYRYLDGNDPGETTALDLMADDLSLPEEIRSEAKDIQDKKDRFQYAKLDKEPICDKLRDLSQQALAGVRADSSETGIETCGESCRGTHKTTADQVRSLKSINEKYLSKNYPTTFTNTCATCHDSALDIAPKVPFSDPDKMNQWLKKSENMTKIRKKLLSNDENERMPPTRKLTDGELKSILSYLSSPIRQ